MAKVMGLSKLWYHATVMPVPEDTAARIDKAVTTFIWRGSPHKVANATMRGAKGEGGANLWRAGDKASALQNMWIVKMMNCKMCPNLRNTIKHWTTRYQLHTKTHINT